MLNFIGYICGINYPLDYYSTTKKHLKKESMKKSLLLRLVLVIVAFVGITFGADAQVTTSSISGTVKDAKGALPGASVKATHTPTGTVYSVSTNNDGRYVINNMRVGGPYTIEVNFVGYHPFISKDIYLNLGESSKLDPVLVDNSVILTEVNITGSRSSVIGRNKTGTSTSVSRNQLDMLPTISRNINDFARLSPIALVRSSSTDGSPLGISFGGQSTRYNQFTIDGANSTDVFGLASNGTNGGQAGINPIPFDAIEQVQVSLSPYDVSQAGFTGGSLNAVTKSGTNEVHGTAFGTYQNQDLVGRSYTTRNKYTDFKSFQYGLSMGGPIIKDKLFFFVAYEGLNRDQPIANQPGGPDGTSRINVATAQTLKDFVMNKYGYDVGKINGINLTRKSDNIFGRIDWNINDKNKLMIRGNYVQGSNYSISDSQTAMSFYNNGYAQSNKTTSVVAELNSKFSNSASNLLRLTYTSIRDKRDPGSPFPSVSIADPVAGTFRFGADYSSQANSLNQDNFTLTDNFNLTLGSHALTFGTDNLFYKTKNIFLQGVYGDYSFTSLAGFMATPQTGMTQYQTTYSTDKSDPFAPAKIEMAQFSLYAQDVWSIRDNFRLTYGVRAEVPVYLNNPVDNPAFNASPVAVANNLVNSRTPKSTIIVTPRLGFNWDVFNNSQTQIRGGAGIFSGRVPMVWVSNQYSNTGRATIKYTANSAAITANGITFNPSSPYQGTPTTTPPTEVDLTDPNFQAPRVLKTNLAIDQKLPWGLVGTIEGTYTKTIKDILYQDMNLSPSTYTLDMGNGVTRPFYNASKIDKNYTNILYLTNTNKGYSYTVYGKLEKQFSKGWMSSVSYTIGHSFNLNDGTSSTALSNYRFAYNVNGLNNLDLATNNNDMGSRVSFMLGKKFTYGNGKFATNLGLFYNGQSGQALSYVVFGDLNGDDGSTTTTPSKSSSNNADLLFIPVDASSFITPLTNIKDPITGVTGTMTGARQYELFQQYVNSDPYLKENIGKNTKRNGTRLPWENHFDFKLVQDINIYKKSVFSFTFDIFNVGNLINKKWGQGYFSSNQVISPLNIVGYTTTGNVVKPNYTFNPSFGTDQYTGRPFAYSDYLSRWSMQIGVRVRY